MKVVVCGGGIIGASVAYHLAELDTPCVVVERQGVACAASGKAGGFLALDWCDSSPLRQLARKSFEMHESLAKKLPDLLCEYRRLQTLSVKGNEDHPKTKGTLPSWLDGAVYESDIIGDVQTTAQIHPYKLTHALMDAAKLKANSEVRIGTVTGMVLAEGGKRVRGVRVMVAGKEEVLEADVVVVAMGPWSRAAAKWFKNCPPIQGRRVHSILLRPSEAITPHALFVKYSGKSGRLVEPEVYPRPDGDVYVCGISDSESLPDDPAQIFPKESSCSVLHNVAGHLSSKLAAAELTHSQACYLPSSHDGLPLIGAIPGVQGAYIASGHNCWGILNAPATGAAMAQLIVHGHSSVVDLEPFDPGRFTK